MKFLPPNSPVTSFDAVLDLQPVLFLVIYHKILSISTPFLHGKLPLSTEYDYFIRYVSTKVMSNFEDLFIFCNPEHYVHNQCKRPIKLSSNNAQGFCSVCTIHFLSMTFSRVTMKFLHIFFLYVGLCSHNFCAVLKI